MGAPRWEDAYDEDPAPPGRTVARFEEAPCPWGPTDAAPDGDELVSPASERPAAGGVDDALASAYRCLARREHSVAELRARLRRTRLEPQAIEEAIAIVVEQGYVDDERYARLMVEDRRTIDGWGVERIRARLEAAGIDRELIATVLGDVDGASELAAATALIRSRCQVPLTGDRERRRALAMLVQRGFESEVAYEAVHACAASGAS